MTVSESLKMLNELFGSESIDPIEQKRTERNKYIGMAKYFKESLSLQYPWWKPWLWRKRKEEKWRLVRSEQIVKELSIELADDDLVRRVENRSW